MRPKLRVPFWEKMLKKHETRANRLKSWNQRVAIEMDRVEARKEVSFKGLGRGTKSVIQQRSFGVVIPQTMGGGSFGGERNSPERKSALKKIGKRERKKLRRDKGRGGGKWPECKLTGEKKRVKKEEEIDSWNDAFRPNQKREKEATNEGLKPGET